MSDKEEHGLRCGDPVLQAKSTLRLGQPPKTSRRRHADFLLGGVNLSRALIGRRKKRRNIELGSGFGRFLAAKIEFSYGAVQTVNLLALGLQWFESTPTQASPRAILQVLKPFGG